MIAGPIKSNPKLRRQIPIQAVVISGQQFVRQNAQTIDRRGLYSEDNRTQGNRAATLAPRQGKLGRREIPFRTDEHQDAGWPLSMFGGIFRQDFLKMDRVGLERPDQLEIESPMLLKKPGERLRGFHFGEPVLATLFRGFHRHGLPFRLLGAGALFIKSHDRAIGENRRDFGRPDLDGFLHDQVHVFSLGNRLPKRNSAPQWRCLRFVQFAELDLLGLAGSNFRRELAAAPIKEHHLIARLEAQHVPAVMRFGVRQKESVGLPIFGRDIEAMHGKSLTGDGADLNE